MSEERKNGLPDFESLIACERPTDSGGQVTFGIGSLKFPDGSEKPATALRITHPDAPNGKVCEFAMLMPTFERLLENIMDVFIAAKATEQDQSS
jgi:hypothetical protein